MGASQGSQIHNPYPIENIENQCEANHLPVDWVFEPRTATAAWDISLRLSFLSGGVVRRRVDVIINAGVGSLYRTVIGIRMPAS